MLLSALHGDADGPFPTVARMKIAKHFACTGDVLTLAEVRQGMLREGSEMGTLLDDNEAVAVDDAEDSSSGEEGA
ncbi:hypothetical protein ACHHYP_08823 [Achlya hypogyna]|uniref:Uncharacterized protein n=1 Tax=Achlya hypogyna TaxID=1202772 RepID=A0A1V9YP60_ACHHY|nr:hypothetical protein ACHHYP_08823 [Achlya hypogyna]